VLLVALLHLLAINSVVTSDCVDLSWQDKGKVNLFNTGNVSN